MSKPNPTVDATKAQITDMFTQSTAVLAQPSAATFERFERRGGLSQAMIFVMMAAVVSAVIGAVFAPLHGDVTVMGQLLSRLIGIPAQFLIFTGAVYLIGKNLFKGTGTFDEVTYSFALFYVPLSILGSLLGLIPLLGWVAGLLITAAMIYFGFLAVKSSMNLRDSVSGAATLILSGVISMWIGLLFL